MGYNAQASFKPPTAIRIMRRRLPACLLPIALACSATVYADAVRLDIAMVEAGAIAERGWFTVVSGEGEVAATEAAAAKGAATPYRRDDDEVVFVKHDRGVYTVISAAWIQAAAASVREVAQATRVRLHGLADGGSTSAAAIEPPVDILPLAGAGSRRGPVVEYRHRASSCNGLNGRQVNHRRTRVVCLTTASDIGRHVAEAALVVPFPATPTRPEPAGPGEFGFDLTPLAMAGTPLGEVPIVATDDGGHACLAKGPATIDAPVDSLRVPKRYPEAKIPFHGC